MDPFEQLTINSTRRDDLRKQSPLVSDPPARQSFTSYAPFSQSLSAGSRPGNPFQEASPSLGGLDQPRRSAFGDLLPTEFAGGAKSGAVTPMKANASSSAFSPLQSALHASPQPSSAPLGAGIEGWSAFEAEPSLTQPASVQQTAGPVEVDQLSQSQVDVLFESADTDHDGRLIGAEARNLFKRASLPDDTSFRIWEKAKVAAPASGDGLTRNQFSVALRLIALAQTRQSLTDELLDQAASPQQWSAQSNLPLPAPVLHQSSAQQAPAAASRAFSPQQQRQTDRQQAPAAASRAFSPQQQRQTAVPQPTKGASRGLARQRQPDMQQSPAAASQALGPQQLRQAGVQQASPPTSRPYSPRHQRPLSTSLLDDFHQPQQGSHTQTEPHQLQTHSWSSSPQSPSVWGTFSAQPGQAPSTDTQQAHRSLLDDHLLTAHMEYDHQSAQHGLQHTQSLPKAPLRPKTVLPPKRHTDMPQQAASQYSTASQLPFPALNQAAPGFADFPSSTSSAPILPVAANPFAGSSFGGTSFDAAPPAANPLLAANPFAASGFGDLSFTSSATPALRTKVDVTPTASPSSSPTKAEQRSQQQRDVPLSLDARLPPLHPKFSAHLTLLAAAHGSLFAGPSSRGGLLQWARPESNIREPSADGPTEHRREAQGIGAVLGAVLSPEDVAWSDGGEDSDAASSVEITIPECKKPTCIHIDETAGILWTGHHDGRVCAFALDTTASVSIAGSQLNSWHAHKIGSVTNIITTPWGEVWTGSSRGIIRIWQDARKRGGEGQKAVRELRKPGGGKPHGEVRSMILEPSGQLVWTGGDKSMALWCALSGAFLGTVDRSKELGMLESTSFRQDIGRPSTQEEWRAKVDLSQGLELDSNARVASRPQGWEVRQCREEQEGWGASSEKATRAFMENLAAKSGQAAVHAGKAAKYIGKLGFKLARNFASDEPKSLPNSRPVEDDAQSNSGDAKKGLHHLRAMTAANDGTVWIAFKTGRIERFKFNGKLLWSKDIGVGIASMCAVGLNIWVGLVDGRIRVYKDGNQTFHEWQAQEAGVISIVPCGSRVVSLAADGSLKGWSALTPSPSDAQIRAAYEEQAHALVKRESMEMLCLTWNVNEQRPDPASPLFSHVKRLCGKASLAVVALQEIEMGSSSVAMAAAKDVLNKSAQEKGNNNAQWWQGQILNSLGFDRWKAVGLRQLSGMLVMVFSLASRMEHVGGVSTASVACGVLGVGGNKGAVAVSFSLYRRRICCVSSHFAAHQGAVEARNRDYAAIARNLRFVNKGWYDTQVQADEEAEVRRKELARLAESESGMDSPRADSELDLGLSEFSSPELLQGQGMRDAEMLVWAGDFNYRIEASYEEVLARLDQHNLEWLLERDQCRREMHAGRVFRYVREGPIKFHPTYKFDKHTSVYDTSEKQRVPAWTDRIFFRGSAFLKNAAESHESLVSLDAGSEEALQPPEPQAPADQVCVRAKGYDACMDVTDSDHKPVWASLLLDVPVTDQHKKRRMCSHLMKETFEQEMAQAKPALQVSCDTVRLSQERGSHSTVTLSNAGRAAAHFCIVAQNSRQWWGQPQGQGTGLPDWLDIFPVSGVVFPQASVTVTLATITDENVYMTHALEAHLAVKVNTVLGPGAVQDLQHTSGFFDLHVTTFQDQADGRQFEF